MALFPSSGDAGGKEQRTFRFKKDTLRELDRMAKEMNVSANQLADDCIVENLIHKMLKNGIQTMTLSRESIMKILALSKDDNEIRGVGWELGGSGPKQIYAIHDVELNWNALLIDLDRVYSKACGWFEFKHYCHRDRTGKETRRLIFTHDAGSKWTAFLEGHMMNMLKSLLNVEPKVVTATDKMLELRA